MSKKSLAIAMSLTIMFSMLMGTLASCAQQRDPNSPVPATSFVRIENFDSNMYIFYDSTTRIVYMFYSAGYRGAMTAYLGPNGYPMSYQNGQLVELTS